ncbi:hypothetical protein B0T10DRAFT_552450 [Thelonectria olida]|uniref:Uncharacterized protein n=1 Tax=Thelonectria olida TaxID=1576542 RepID=A0A9P8VTQ4_9HYPO|nr:hypothetical protein B0T10DRAFT_552450 [Thelonectria olida]
MALAMQWSLDQTSSSAISVATGILRAATADNVQPLAILACEQFGNTIAMCQETILKIERLVVPTPEPAVLAFLKSTVGYFPNDTVSHLGKSLAGVRFLSLAAAMVSTLGASEAAMTMQTMLESTASDATLLPSIRNIRELLSSIESKCCKSGFADQVAGWQLFFGQLDGGLRDDIQNRRMQAIPHGPGMEALLDSLRQLHRVGNDDITKVTVRATRSAPWTVAFIKWCLGSPPSIFWDDGTPMLEKDGTFSVIIQRDRDHKKAEEFQVTIHSSIRGPSDLVSTTIDNTNRHPYMVSIRSFGELIMCHAFDDGLATRAVQEAMPYALRRVVENFTGGGYSPTRTQSMDEFTRGLMPSPFPPDYAISQVYRLLFAKKLEFKTLDDDLKITDLPLISAYFQELSCSCTDCKPGSLRNAMCPREVFLGKLFTLVADVLALSLFHYPESLKIEWMAAPSRYSLIHGEALSLMPPVRRMTFFEAVQSILRDKPRSETRGNDCVLDWALSRVGHRLDSEAIESFVISSFNGQTVWPTVYDSHVYAKRGYLQLSWLPGLLIHKKDVYDIGTSVGSSLKASTETVDLSHEPVVIPRNLFPGMKLQWSVSADSRIAGRLQIGLMVRDADKTYSTSHSPSTIFRISCKDHIYITGDCCHGPNAKLNEVDKLSKFTGPVVPAVSVPFINPKNPFFMSAPSQPQDQTISVVAVDGCDELRFFALSGVPEEGHVVLRRAACLACCLDICRKVDAKALIL